MALAGAMICKNCTAPVFIGTTCPNCGCMELELYGDEE